MKVAIKVAHSLALIDPKDILYIKAEGSYSVINKTNGEIIKVSKNLLTISALFVKYKQLQKCHRSYFANISYVNSVLSVGVQKYKIVLNNNEMIPISPSYKKEFMQGLKKIYTQKTSPSKASTQKL